MNRVESEKISIFEWIPLLLFVVSFFVRILYLVSVLPHPWVTHPIVDEIAYFETAKNIAKFNYENVFPLFRAPLWPFVMAPVTQIAGDSFLYIRVLNSFIGSLSVLSLYRLAKHMFGRRIALASSFIHVVAGISLVLHTSGLSTPLYVLLLIESLYQTLLLRDKHGDIRKVFVASILWALTILARPIVFPAAIVVLVYVLWNNKKMQLLSMSIMLLLMSPIILINNYYGGDGLFIAYSGGINLYLGNNDNASGYSANHPYYGTGWSEQDLQEEVKKEKGNNVTPGELSRYYTKEAMGYWITSPFKAATLFFRKICLNFGAREISNNGDIYYFAESRMLLKYTLLIPLFLILPLSFMMNKSLLWNRRINIPYIAMVLLLLITSLFFVTSRYRYPVITVMTPYALYAIVSVIRERKYKYLFMLILLAPMVAYGTTISPEKNYNYGKMIDGMLYHDAERYDKAIDIYNEVIRKAPDTPLIYQLLGNSFSEIHDYDNAIICYEKEMLKAPKERTALRLSELYGKIGKTEKKIKCLINAKRLGFNSKVVARKLSEAYAENAMQKADSTLWLESYELFLKARKEAPEENQFFSFGMANALWKMNRKPEAEVLVDTILKRDPNFTPAVDWRYHKWKP